MNIPAAIRAGDTATWHDNGAADPLGNAITSPIWTLTYYLRANAAGAGATAVGTADSGGGWNITIPAATTAGLSAGVMSWQAVATLSTSVFTIGTGRLTVKPSLAYAGTPGAFDGRSPAQQDLDAVQAAIRALISGGVSQYTIGTRTATKLDLPKLIDRESRLKAIVNREQMAESLANGLGNPRSLYVRFS